MKCSSFYSVLVTVILICTFQQTTLLSAQSIWLDNDQCNSISIEILKPGLAGYNEYTFISSAIFLSGRYLLDENIILVSELPFAHGGFEYEYIYIGFDKLENEFSKHETIIGNPYLGVEIRGQDLPVFGEIGVRIPFTPDDKQYATMIGTYSDFDRFEAFTPSTFTLTSKGNYRFMYTPNFSFRLRGGPAFLIYTGYKGRLDEIWFDYSGQFEYKAEQFSFISGISGRFSLSKSNQDFNKRDAHHFGFAASAGFGIVRPGLLFRIPIDGNAFVNFAYGFNFGVQLP